MFGIMRWRGTAKTLSVSLVLAMLLNLTTPALAAPKSSSTKLAGKISEVSPPEVIQQLHDLTDKYQPQVSIVSPRPNEVIQDNSVSVKFSVKDLPLHKDEKLGLGLHLHVFLDDQPYQAVYDVSQPIVFKDLAAGTHTIRAFAGRPWHESFKNDGAFAQTTFHVFTKTPNNNPDPKLPLLTYSRPQATYGAEPVLLDFYLTNAPLHLVAQEDDKDEVADWKVKVTVNGDSFSVDRWQPIYLQGFKPGKNWVQLEYVDDKGNPVPNVYNNAARVFTYEPNGQDALSRLVRGEIPFGEAVSIVDPNYKPAAKAPEVAPTPEVTPVPVISPAITPSPEPEVSEPVKEAPKPAEEAQEEAPKPAGGFFNRFKKQPEVPKPEPQIKAPTVTEPEITAPKATEPEVIEPDIAKPEEPVIVEPEAPKALEKPKAGFFNRFKRPEAPKAPVEPSSEPEAVTEPEEKADEPEVLTPISPEVPPVKPSPASGGFFNRFKPPVAPIVPAPVEIPEIEQPAVETAPAPVEIAPAPEVKEKPKSGFFDRFKRREVKPAPIEPPAPVEEAPAPEVETPPTLEAEPEEVEIAPAPEVKEKPKSSFFDRFKRPDVKPAPTSIEKPAPVEEAPIEQPAPVDVTPPAVLETKPAEETKPEPNLLEKLREATPKPAEPPAVEKVEPPAVKEAPSETPAPLDFEPQTELERRLGIPLKPRVSQPAPSPEPALSSEGNAE